MAKMKGDDFGIELPRKRLVGCLGLLVGGTIRGKGIKERIAVK